MWKRWFPKLRKACEATEPATVIENNNNNSEGTMMLGKERLLLQEP